MKQFLIFGLGNPGSEFSHTRHNLGADMVDVWANEAMQQGKMVSDWRTHEKFHARIREVSFDEVEVTILSQLVFMNDSGKVLSAYLRYHELERKNILLIHDEIELPLGDTKIQEDGSAKGHNGVRSIHEHLGDTNIPRLKIGVGRPHDTTPIEKFVLSTFAPSEKEVLKQREAEILQIITTRVLAA